MKNSSAVRSVDSVLRKIDIHTHILPKHLPRFKEKFGYGGFIHLDHHKPCCARMMRDDGTFFREIQDNCWEPAKRIDEMDERGIEIQVLSTVPVLFSYWAKAEHTREISQTLNDHLAEVLLQYPKRFKALATVPLQDPDLAIQELERCMGTLGFSGVQIGSHIQDWNLSDPALFPFFEACERLNASVFVHPWDMMGQSQMQKYWLPWLVGMPAETSLAICSMIFSGIFERLPKLRVAFAHGGGSFPGTLGRIQHGFECRPDLCAIDNQVSPRDSVGKFYVDSLVHDSKALELILDVFGPHRIALGSDYPFPLGEAKPGHLIESLPHVDLNTKQRLLRGSALEWLGLPQ